VAFFHPQVMRSAPTRPGPSIDQMVDFVIAGLSPRTGRSRA